MILWYRFILNYFSALFTITILKIKVVKYSLTNRLLAIFFNIILRFFEVHDISIYENNITWVDQDLRVSGIKLVEP